MLSSDAVTYALDDLGWHRNPDDLITAKGQRRRLRGHPGAVVCMEEDTSTSPPPIPSRPTREAGITSSPAVAEIPQIPPRPSRARSKSPGTNVKALLMIARPDVLPEESSIPIIPPRPRQSMDSERSVEQPTIPARPTKRPEKREAETESTDLPSIPQRPTRGTAEASETDDYLIDGIEKRVPLLPASINTGEELTPSLNELISIPDVPRRPTRRESMESRGSESHITETEVPTIPRRPAKHSTDEETQDHPIIPQRPSRKTSMEREEPAIPRRPPQRSQKSVEEENPVIPHRPSRKTSMEIEEPTIPQRPVRQSSIKSHKSDDAETEPVIPARPRRSSIKSIPETELPEVETEPLIPARPLRTPSIKSIPDASPENPIVPQRPTRKSSVKSFKSQHSIEEETELEKIPSLSVESIPERRESPPVEESGTSQPGVESMEEDKAAPPIEEIPSSPHQHPAEISTAAIPIIPSRPKKDKEPPSEQRLAEYAALTSQPIIPPRPTKSKPSKPIDAPKVAMDQTPEIIQTEGGQFESDDEPISSTRKDQIPNPSLDTQHAITKSPASEIQTEIVSKPVEEKAPPKIGVKSPPIPARPLHKLAKQFEPVAPPVKEKPVPPPRPVKPLGGKFAGLRAQFAQSLNEKLAKPAPPLPTKKEEEVHSMDPEPQLETNSPETVEEKKVGDVRKGRARGPQRRPPTVKPIIPTGWGISTIATVFEQPVATIQEKEVETQTGELVIESATGVKTVYVEGGVVPGGHGVTHHVVPMTEVTTDEVLPTEEVQMKDAGEDNLGFSGEFGLKADQPPVEPVPLEETEHAAQEAYDVREVEE
jgi:hypothetical protein